jgi:UDP-N-acetylglucosamine 2-epimerase (non-hydrolysing)
MIRRRASFLWPRWCDIESWISAHRADRAAKCEAMQKLKVMTVVGTRPEIIRLSRVMARLDQYTEHVLVHTGQNYDYELNEIFFKDLEVRKPDHFLQAAGVSAADTVGKVVSSIGALLMDVKPDALLLLGDTNSCMSVIAAKRAKVPVFHMEAGNRCFDQRVPEELNRRIVDHASDVNMPYSDIARGNLLREGIAPDLVIKTGSPMFEVLDYYRSAIEASDVLERMELQPAKYFLVSVHREENVDLAYNFRSMVAMLNVLADEFALPIIVSTHPRTRNRIDKEGVTFHPLIRLMKPLGFFDYNKMQMNARAVLSDSGTITEESAILNFPALNIRETHERLEGMEEGAVMMVGMNSERVLQALTILTDQPRGGERLIRAVADYSMPNVSDKVVRIIHSYTDYVKRVVWRDYGQQ